MKFTPLHLATALVGFLFSTSCSAEVSPVVDAQHYRMAQNRLSGVAYNPYRKNAAVNIQQDVNIMLKYTNRIRLYGTDGDVLQRTIAAVAAHKGNAQIFAGIYFDANEQSYRTQFKELMAAVNQNKNAFRNHVKAVIVGNEVILKKQVTEKTVIARINEVRRALRDAGVAVPVTTSEPFPTYSAELIDAVDVIVPNLHPYFDGVAINGAVDKVFLLMDLVKKRDRSGRKPLVIGEVGWPFHGKKNGNAIPSPENAKQFINSFVKAAAVKNINYFYFEAFDSTWKEPGEFGVEQSWGVYSANRSSKIPDY